MSEFGFAPTAFCHRNFHEPFVAFSMKSSKSDFQGLTSSALILGLMIFFRFQRCPQVIKTLPFLVTAFTTGLKSTCLRPLSKRPSNVSSWVGRGGSWGHSDKRGYNRGSFPKEIPSTFDHEGRFLLPLDCTSIFPVGEGGEWGACVRGTHMA